MKTQIEIQTKALQKALQKSALLPEVNTSDGVSHLVHLYSDGPNLVFQRQSVAGELTVTLKSGSDMGVNLWLPFERLNRVVESLNGETTVLKSDGASVLIESGRSKSKLALLPCDAKRPVIVRQKPQSFTLPAEVFADHLGAVKAAYATAGLSRPMIEGMLLQPHDGKTYLCGYDGRRGNCIVVADVEITAYLPGRSSNALYALAKLAEKDDEITLIYGGKWLEVECGDVQFSTPTIEGTVPLIMSTYGTKETAPLATFNRLEMLAAADSLRSLDHEYIRLQITEDQIVVWAETAAERDERIVTCEKGVERNLSISAKFLADMMRCLREEKATLRTEEGDYASFFIEPDRLCIAGNIRIQ